MPLVSKEIGKQPVKSSDLRQWLQPLGSGLLDNKASRTTGPMMQGGSRMLAGVPLLQSQRLNRPTEAPTSCWLAPAAKLAVALLICTNLVRTPRAQGPPLMSFCKPQNIYSTVVLHPLSSSTHSLSMSIKLSSKL